MDPIEAQRLGRLRMLLVDASRRVGDESELGTHLSVLAIDGIGELALGLCLEHCGIQPKRRDGVPGRLSLLLRELKIKPRGLQGFGELHRVRNLVQHAGVLPSPDQLPRWLAETESLVDELLLATFQIGLSEVGAAAGVEDEKLRTQLEEAERQLESGEAESSFDASWNALEVARRKFREETGLGTSPGSFGMTNQLGRIDQNLGNLSSEVEALREQIELSSFTAEPGEWLWFRQRQGEKFRGLPITIADAKRAFSFVLSWTLWFESYIARHGVDRWDRWQEEQRAPSTGVAGGPHIADVRLGARPGAPGGRTENLREWIFQLTDVPDTEPSFDWAISQANQELGSSPFTSAYLSPDGGFSISCPADLAAPAVKKLVSQLIDHAKIVLRGRELEDAQDRQQEGEILQRFERGLRNVGCDFSGLKLHRSDGGYRIDEREARVWIDIGTDSDPSWFGKGLDESFEHHFPEYVVMNSTGGKPYGSMWCDVAVPISWNPERVGPWVTEAAEYDREQREFAEQERKQVDDAEQQALAEMKELLK